MATLQIPLMLATVLSAFKTRVPMLDMISLDATADKIKKNQTVYAHIRSLPTSGAYGTEGFFSNTNDGQDLLADVPLVADQFIHVTKRITFNNAITDQKIDKDMEDCAYVLGKAVVDHALGKAAAAANFTYKETAAVASTTKDTLGAIRKKMNKNKAGSDRYGLVNSDVAAEFDEDPLMINKDYYGKISGGDPLLTWSNVAGFRNIMEYTDLPTTANLTGLFWDKRAIAVKTGLPDHGFDLARELGIPSVANHFIQQDPETGIALLAITHMKPGTLDLYLTLTLIFGSAAGAQGGAAGTITDKAGCRLVSA